MRLLPRFGGAALVAVLALSACGSDKDATAGARMVQTAAQSLLKGRNAPPPAPVTREQLNAFATPMIQVEVPQLGLTTYVVPVAVTQGVQTWSTPSDQTVSFRDGIMVATRGFGPDLMHAEAPSAARIAQGSGSVTRSHTYLDGADRPQRFDFTCTLSVAGAETVTVVDRQHSTRHVLEQCSGKQGEFTNEYWFENGEFLRKSKQLMVIGWAPLTLSRVID